MSQILLPGAPASPALLAVKAALDAALDKKAEKLFPGCTKGSTAYDAPCVAAVREVQTRKGLVADGIIGPRTRAALGLDKGWATLPPGLTLDVVQKMFPQTRRSNIERNLPYVLAALRAVAPGAEKGVVPREILLSALATIRAETEGFVPISELRSKYNSAPNGPDFELYIGKLGNKTLADAQHYCGRGYVQLTGQVNYATYGKLVGLDLLLDYARANDPEVAACLLAEFIAAKATPLLAALRQAPPAFLAARKLVNGGSHGIDRYTEAYQTGARLLPAAPAAAPRAGALRASAAAAKAAKARATPDERYRLNAKPDPLDLRDRSYTPRVSPLPPEHPSADTLARHLQAYTDKAGLILNQGKEGSCTGFGLAGVINFQRWVLGGAKPEKVPSVSPRMLYEMARRYDEYEGENYDGSSCRGAIRGFHQNGVCSVQHWPYDPEQPTEPAPDWQEQARDCTLGVYYRIDTKLLTDLQAAIVEAGAIFVSVRTHDGWHDVPTVSLTSAAPRRSRSRKAAGPLSKLPDVAWPGTLDGAAHAFALVGFDRHGFILQNSWGADWGAGGFARISYADWLENAMDAWVLALGVPGVLAREVKLQVRGGGSASAQAAGAGDGIDLRRYTVEMGNDGRIDSFYGADERLRTLDQQCGKLPADWLAKTTPAGQPWRVAIYAHGGLTSLDEALRKTGAMAPYFLDNGIYPLFLGWKTGALETPKHIIEDGWNDLVRKGGARAGAGFGDKLREWRDQAIEDIARGPVRRLWEEMKENARRAAQERHGLDLLARALDSLAEVCPTTLELHFVGHSAGSILLGHLLRRMSQRKSFAPTGIHLYAPACTVAFANSHYGYWSERTHLHVLSDRAELADRVTPAYGKSLLFLVANALESDRRTPLLGMARSFDPRLNGKWNGLAATLDALNTLQQDWPLDANGRHPRVHQYDQPITTRRTASGQVLQSESPSHGGFDNDVAVLTDVLTRIRGAAPARAVLDLSKS